MRSVWESFHTLSLGDTHSGFSTSTSLSCDARCIAPLDAQYSKFSSPTLHTSVIASFLSLFPRARCYVSYDERAFRVDVLRAVALS
jgi:hypothetical protein